jgi:hypothetical protein
MIRKSLILPLAFLLLSSLSFFDVQAQTDNDELLASADQYFVQEDYEKSLMLYSQLIEKYPANPDINYKYGLSMFFKKHPNKEKAIKHLEFAEQNDLKDYQVYYYLGKAYHQCYRFGEALQAFNTFKEKTGDIDFIDINVDKEIEKCNYSLSYVDKVRELKVFERKEILKDNFYKSYNMSDFSGRFMQIPEKLRSKIDIEKNNTNFGYFSNNLQVLFFSSYGKTAETGKDIYKSFFQPNGNWSLPERLNDEINTIADEDFPFVSSDGKQLFYSSNGKGSMGGYDIFKSDASTDNKWFSPENMGFPVNSPFDDFLYVVSTSGDFAYFSSQRNCNNDLISIYKVATSYTRTVKEGIRDDLLNTGDKKNYQRTVMLLREKSKLGISSINEYYLLDDLKEDVAENNTAEVKEEPKEYAYEEKLLEIKYTHIPKQDSLATKDSTVASQPMDTIISYELEEPVLLSEEKEELKEEETEEVVEVIKKPVEKKTDPLAENEVYLSLQIGVFSKIKTNEQLHNAPDLFFETTPNGYFKYFSGRYYSMKDAKKAQSEIKQLGFNDAFIVGFRGKTKIKMREALNQLK